jgi:hypothetical protein
MTLPVIESIRALTPTASTTAADGGHDVLGLDIGAGAAGRIRRRRSSSASARRAVLSATT